MRGISVMRLGEELSGVCLEVALAPRSAEEVDVPGMLRAVPSGGADVDRHAAHRVDRHLHRAGRDAGAQLAGRLAADQLGQDGERDLVVLDLTQVEARVPTAGERPITTTCGTGSTGSR